MGNVKSKRFLGSTMAMMLSAGKILEKTPFYKIKNAVARGKFSRSFYSHSSYSRPHQNTWERSRRLRQIAAGTLQRF